MDTRGRRRQVDSPAYRESGVHVSHGNDRNSSVRTGRPNRSGCGARDTMPMLAGTVLGIALWGATINYMLTAQISLSGEDAVPQSHEQLDDWASSSVKKLEEDLRGDSDMRKASEDESKADYFPTVHVALTLTLSHSIGAIGVINSSLQNSATPKALKFHLVSTPLDRLRLQTALSHAFPVESKRGQFNIVSFNERAHVTVRDQKRGKDLSKNIVYARYHFGELLADLERVIYLDVDLIVQHDLRDLWDTDMGTQVLGAVQRCRTRFSSSFGYGDKGARAHLAKFEPKECVFNNGVLLYNLKLWRQASPPLVDELLQWTTLNLNVPLYSLGSQPPFNLVFYRKYFKLDPRWNIMDVGDSTIHPNTQTADEAHILHWNGAEKPWKLAPRTLYSEKFTRYVPRWESMLSESDDFTLVIVTQGQRLEALEQVLRHVSGCEQLYEVLLVWNQVGVPCPAALFTVAAQVGIEMRCLPQNQNDVQARLLIASEISTEAVLHHDDDALIRLEDMKLAFKVWKRHRDQIVGFEPRVHRHDPVTGWSYGFHLSEGYYTLVIGKFFFISRTMMEKYAADTDLVEANRGIFCEDISINFLVAKENGGKGCIVVQSNHWELPTNSSVGLSTRISSAQWSKLRQQCVGRLSHHFTDGFLRQFPRTSHIVIAYDSTWNILVSRPVTVGESICSNAKGVKECRVPQCQDVHDRKPCYIPHG